MTAVVVVDDELRLADLVAGYLRKEGYDVSTANDGPRGLELALSQNPDVIILDVMLPGMDGIEVCRQLRQSSDAYVIMLTARAEEVDKIVGLSVGADDYLTKPFSPRELVARVKAVLRRPRAGGSTAPPAPPVYRIGNLAIDTGRHEVTLAGQTLQLTTREFDIIATLASQHGIVFTRPQLLEKIWGQGYYDDHLVDVHVGNLRKKLENEGGGDLIETVRGVGYRLALPRG